MKIDFEQFKTEINPVLSTKYGVSYSKGEGCVCVFVRDEISRGDILQADIQRWENEVLDASNYIDSVTLFLYQTSQYRYSSLYIILLKDGYSI